ncbi:MAG: UDP-N-acetylglucosamine--dolichyl-phosphate N-acetylglucosaminephosphotransferase [Candidatus Bathyarchaeia archaeon]
MSFLFWAIFSFLITYFSMPLAIKIMKRKGWAGIDVHKKLKVECAEPGGLVILFSLSVSFLLMYLSNNLDKTMIGSAFTIVFSGLVGLLDDVVTLRQRSKVMLMMFAGLPLALSYDGPYRVSLPLVGYIEFGIVLYMLIIILAVNVASNLTNMLAGFNGLEAGFAAVACGILGAASIFIGEWSAAAISLVSLGPLLAFLKYNWYPAKIFPGDTGTLMFGAIIASVAILGDELFLAVSIMMPAILDFTLKMLHGKPFGQRKIYGDTKVDEAGFLNPPGYAALPHAFMKVAPTSEKRLVVLLLLSEAILGIVALFMMVLL